MTSDVGCIQIDCHRRAGATGQPMVEGVAVPMVAKLLNEKREFLPNELIVASATTLLDELFCWAQGLKAMRERQG